MNPTEHGFFSVFPSNVAALRPTMPGYLTVWPSGLALPDVSNLDYDPGRNVPNLVVCKLGADGAVSLIANAGELDMIADVVGCFTNGGAGVVPVAPSRLNPPWARRP